MSVLNFSLLRIFQGYLVICCLIINVLCFCCLTAAILDYQISFRLSTTFFTFLNFYFFCFYRSIKCSDIIPCFLFVCQHLFSTFFKFLYQHFTFPENKRRRRDLNPRTAINDLLPFQGSPFSHLGTSPSQLRHKKTTESFWLVVFLKRRGWDSNPRALSDKRFSRPPRYDHFDTSAYILLFLFVVLANDKMYSSIVSEYCQHFFKTFLFFLYFRKNSSNIKVFRCCNFNIFIRAAH